MSGIDAPPDQAEPTSAEPSFVALAREPVGDAVSFRVTAPADRPLFLENCNGAISWGLERPRDGAWVPAWGAEVDGCHSAPIEIAAGSMRTFDGFVAGRPGEPLPAGSYRLAVYGLYFVHDDRDHAAGTEVPHALRVSPTFTRPVPGTGR